MVALSKPVLTVEPTDESGESLRLTVSFNVWFTPAEVIARLVLDEFVTVYPDFTGVDEFDPQVQLTWMQIRFPIDAVAAANQATPRTRTLDVPRAALNVVQNGGYQDAVIAVVEVRPYQPPAAVSAASNTVSGEWSV